MIKDGKGNVIENRQLLIKDADDFSVRLNTDAGPFYIEMYGSYDKTAPDMAFSVTMDDAALQTNTSEVFLFTRTKDDGTALKNYWDTHHN
jgi:hypothetical protein